MKEGKLYRLGEICDFQGGSQPPKQEWIKAPKEGYVRMLQIRDFTQSRDFVIEYVKCSNKLRYCKEDDILIGRYGASVGKILTGLSGAYNVAIIKTIPNEQIITKPYIRRFFEGKSFQALLQKVCGQRTAQAGFSKEDIVDFPIFVPPLSEQQRIVNLLDAEFAKIDTLKANAERNLQNAKDLFQATLKKELEPKDGWTTKTLGDVCDVQCGSTPLRSEPLFWENGTYPWFTVDDIREQGRVITDTKQKITKLAWDKLRVFPANSVLLCCTASVGEYAITTIPLTSNQQFNGLTIKKGIDITPMYLFHFASTLKDKLLKLSGKATIDFVSGTKVRSIVISYPSIIEQQSIVARLDVLNEKCESLQANYEKTIALCDDMKQALLRKAFNGEI